MIAELKTWGEKIRQGARAARDIGRPTSQAPQKIFFVGMGGSGIAGRIVAGMLRRSFNGIIQIIDGPALPVPLTSAKDVLVYATSYSGNTWEALDATRALVALGAQPIVSTHGGTLLAYAKENSLPLYRMPACIAPRASLGYTLGFLCEQARLWGLIQRPADFTEKLAQRAEIAVDAWHDVTQHQKLIGQLLPAAMIHVWGVAWDSEAVAYRAQTQFNENSKIIPFFGIIPELFHNVLASFSDCVQPQFVLFFETDHQDARLRRCTKKVAGMLAERGIGLASAPIFPGSWEEQLIDMLVWTDFLTYHLAGARGVDALEVKMIEDFKRRMAAP